MLPFGTQLIGQTEKALNQLLMIALADTGLGEPEWVTLRLSSQRPEGVSLADFVRDRAHFASAQDVVARLTARGLIAGDVLTDDGQSLVERTSARISELTAPIWTSISADDAETAARVLNAVLHQARAVLTASSVS